MIKSFMCVAHIHKHIMCVAHKMISFKELAHKMISFKELVFKVVFKELFKVDLPSQIWVFLLRWKANLWIFFIKVLNLAFGTARFGSFFQLRFPDDSFSLSA